MVEYERFIELARSDAARCGQEDWNIPHDFQVQHEDAFYATWITDGVHYPVDPTEPVEAEPEPEIVPLLEFLDDLGVKLRHVNEIRRMATKGSFKTTVDHEGSWQRYSFKAIPIAEIHEKLAELGLVEPKPSPPAP